MKELTTSEFRRQYFKQKKLEKTRGYIAGKAIANCGITLKQAAAAFKGFAMAAGQTVEQTREFTKQVQELNKRLK